MNSKQTTILAMLVIVALIATTAGYALSQARTATYIGEEGDFTGDIVALSLSDSVNLEYNTITKSRIVTTQIVEGEYADFTLKYKLSEIPASSDYFASIDSYTLHMSDGSIITDGTVRSGNLIYCNVDVSIASEDAVIDAEHIWDKERTQGMSFYISGNFIGYEKVSVSTMDLTISAVPLEKSKMSITLNGEQMTYDNTALNLPACSLLLPVPATDMTISSMYAINPEIIDIKSVGMNNYVNPAADTISKGRLAINFEQSTKEFSIAYNVGVAASTAKSTPSVSLIIGETKTIAFETNNEYNNVFSTTGSVVAFYKDPSVTIVGINVGGSVVYQAEVDTDGKVTTYKTDVDVIGNSLVPEFYNNAYVLLDEQTMTFDLRADDVTDFEYSAIGGEVCTVSQSSGIITVTGDWNETYGRMYADYYFTYTTGSTSAYHGGIVSFMVLDAKIAQTVAINGDIIPQAGYEGAFTHLESHDTSIATIVDGKIHGVSAGKVEIGYTWTSDRGVSYSSTVLVTVTATQYLSYNGVLLRDGMTLIMDGSDDAISSGGVTSPSYELTNPSGVSINASTGVISFVDSATKGTIETLTVTGTGGPVSVSNITVIKTEVVKIKYGDLVIGNNVTATALADDYNTRFTLEIDGIAYRDCQFRTSGTAFVRADGSVIEPGSITKILPMIGGNVIGKAEEIGASSSVNISFESGSLVEGENPITDRGSIATGRTLGFKVAAEAKTISTDFNLSYVVAYGSPSIDLSGTVTGSNGDGFKSITVTWLATGQTYSVKHIEVTST
jgi:hypothetical protein